MGETTRASMESTEERVSSLFQSVILILLGFVVAAFVAGIGRDAFLSAGLLAPDTIETRAATDALQFFGFGLAVVVWLGLTRDWDLVDVRVPTREDLGWFVGGTVVLIVGGFLVGYLFQLLGLPPAENQVIERGRENPRYFLYMIPITLLLVGPAEELLFRGGVQGLLRRTWGPNAAIVIAGLLFGFVHLFALTDVGSQFAYVAVAALLGMVLGALYEWSGNILVPAAVHGVYNVTIYVLGYFEIIGGL